MPGSAFCSQAKMGAGTPLRCASTVSQSPFSQGHAVSFHAWFGLRRKWCCEAIPFGMKQSFHGC